MKVERSKDRLSIKSDQRYFVKSKESESEKILTEVKDNKRDSHFGKDNMIGIQGHQADYHSFRHFLEGNDDEVLTKAYENHLERANERSIIGLKYRGGEDWSERSNFHRRELDRAKIESNPSYTENINVSDDKNRYDYEKHKLTLEHNERMFNKNIRNQKINDYINRKIAKKKYKDEKKAAKKRYKNEKKFAKKRLKLDKKLAKKK